MCQGGKDKSSECSPCANFECHTVSSWYVSIRWLVEPKANQHSGGRNYETYSEDPVLLGNLASEYVKGMRESGRYCLCAFLKKK